MRASQKSGISLFCGRTSGFYNDCMPRELRFCDGPREIVPMPMENARISRILSRYRRKLYKIFVDESFRSFFSFDVPTGYLCYAAVESLMKNTNI